MKCFLIVPINVLLLASIANLIFLYMYHLLADVKTENNWTLLLVLEPWVSFGYNWIKFHKTEKSPDINLWVMKFCIIWLNSEKCQKSLFVCIVYLSGNLFWHMPESRSHCLSVFETIQLKSTRPNYFDSGLDITVSPWNKVFGTIQLNCSKREKMLTW